MATGSRWWRRSRGRRRPARRTRASGPGRYTDARCRTRPRRRASACYRSAGQESVLVVQLGDAGGIRFQPATGRPSRYAASVGQVLVVDTSRMPKPQMARPGSGRDSTSPQSRSAGWNPPRYGVRRRTRSRRADPWRRARGGTRRGHGRRWRRCAAPATCCRPGAMRVPAPARDLVEEGRAAGGEDQRRGRAARGPMQRVDRARHQGRDIAARGSGRTRRPALVGGTPASDSLPPWACTASRMAHAGASRAARPPPTSTSTSTGRRLPAAAASARTVSAESAKASRRRDRPPAVGRAGRRWPGRRSRCRASACARRRAAARRPRCRLATVAPQAPASSRRCTICGDMGVMRRQRGAVAMAAEDLVGVVGEGGFVQRQHRQGHVAVARPPAATGHVAADGVPGGTPR